MFTQSEEARVRKIDVVELIDQQPISAFQIRLIVLCALVAMLDGFDTQSIAFVAPIIAGAFGIKINAFGPIFSAGLVGMTLGALFLGPLADRYGRKQVITASTFAFGLFTLATVLADSVTSLMTYRFLTGLGLGAAMPNIIALTSEYSPKRARAWLVTIMFVGFPFGAVVGGIISSMIIPIWGWQSVFITGGIVPIALSALLLAILPESVRFLVHKQAKSDDIAAILRKITVGVSYAPSDKFFIQEKVLPGVSVMHLFTGGRAIGTLLLWIPFFMNLLLLFFMYNWLPPLLQQAGLPIGRAIIATVLFNLGGVIGGLVLARLIDRLGPFNVLATAYAMGTIAVAAIGAVSSSIVMIMAVVFVAGFFVIGAQLGSNALAASYYPTAIRSTGIGWALGVGRVGSIIGPLVGGLLMSLNWPFKDLFLMAAAPAACATIAIFLFRFVAHHDGSTDIVVPQAVAARK